MTVDQCVAALLGFAVGLNLADKPKPAIGMVVLALSLFAMDRIDDELRWRRTQQLDLARCAP